MTDVDTALTSRYALPMQPAVEKNLLEQARNGQETAFAQLVEAHSGTTTQLAWRLVGNRPDQTLGVFP